MNWFDIVLIAVLLLSMVMGIWRGFLNMLLPLIGLIVGVYLAGLYAKTVGGWLPIHNAQNAPQYAEWAGYAIIVVGTLIVSILLTVILSHFFHWTFLKWLDRSLGGILGLALGALLCAAALAACVKYGLGKDFIKGSAIAKLMLKQFPAILALLPASFDSIKQFFQ